MRAESRAPIAPFVGPGQIENQVADLTMVASADVTLAQLQEKLAEHDQWLPIDGDPTLSLGQLISMNSTGPLRLGFGGWRDIALQFQLRTKRGPLVTVGARTMKNVAGYDVTKLLVGQRGLLGELVTISTRTYRRPAGALIATFAVDAGLIATLLPSHSRPAWALARGNAVHCGYFGDKSALTFFENAIADHKPTFERMSLDLEIAFRRTNWSQRNEALTFRMSIPPTQTLAGMKDLDLADSAADLAFGIIVGSCKMSERQRVRDIGRSRGTVLFDDKSPTTAMVGPQRELIDRIIAAF